MLYFNSGTVAIFISEEHHNLWDAFQELIQFIAIPVAVWAAGCFPDAAEGRILAPRICSLFEISATPIFFCVPVLLGGYKISVCSSFSPWPWWETVADPNPLILYLLCYNQLGVETETPTFLMDFFFFNFSSRSCGKRWLRDKSIWQTRRYWDEPDPSQQLQWQETTEMNGNKGNSLQTFKKNHLFFNSEGGEPAQLTQALCLGINLAEEGTVVTRTRSSGVKLKGEI